jgi:hypothetical protein
MSKVYVSDSREGSRVEPFPRIALTVLVLVLLAILPFFLSTGMRAFYLSEGGPIQVFSAAGYLVVAATLIHEFSYEQLRERWYFVLIPIAMCLREMDFHAHFTTMSITKIKFYLSGDVPLIEKLFGVAVFAVLGVAFVLMIRRHGKAFIRGLRSLDATAVAIFAAAMSVVLSKILDGAVNKLASFGYVGSSGLDLLTTVPEEVLELGIPVFLAIAAFSYSSNRRPISK